MKPYIGILIDSFREAVNSKVLWALLVCWTLLLLGLAPFGYIIDDSNAFTNADINNTERLIEKLAENADGEGKTGGQRIASKLDPKLVSRIKKSAKQDSRSRLRERDISEALDSLLSDPSLYDAEIFPNVAKRDELQELVSKPTEDLTEKELVKLNRHILWLSYPLAISKPKAESLWFGYAGLKIGSSPLRLSRKQLSEFVEPLALQIIITLGLGMLTVFVGVIVTSSIIPETFQSGSLHLMLSKPISRVGLYLAKFFGGTIFMLVNLAYVLFGLYLIAGIRFQIWNEGLLLCIPIMLFAFTIFYSVSGLAGLIWRNAIICIVACILFWFGCFLIGFVRGIFYDGAELKPRIERVMPVGDFVSVVTQSGEFKIWNEEFSVWQPAVENEDFSDRFRTFGPIYDPASGQLLVKKFAEHPIRGPTAKTRAMQLVQLPTSSEKATSMTPAEKAAMDRESTNESNSSAEADVTDAPVTEETQDASDAQEPVENAQPVDDFSELFDAIDGLEGEEGLTNFASDLAAVGSQPEASARDEAPEEAEDDEDAAPIQEDEEELLVTDARGARREPAWRANAGPFLPEQLFDLLHFDDRVLAVCRSGLFELDLNELGKTEDEEEVTFELVSPPRFFLSQNSTADFLADGSGVVVYSSGDITVLNFEGGKLEIAMEATPEFEENDATVAALIRMNEQFCVLARNQMPLELLDSQLQPLGQIPLPGSQDVKQLQWIPGSGKLGILTHTGKLLALDCESQSISRLPLPFQGRLTSMRWVAENEVWLATQPNAVHQVEVNSQSILASYSPELSTFEAIYFWGVSPFYEAFPKPGGLNDAMTYALTSNKTQGLSFVTNNLQNTRIELQVWKPILANLAFVFVVLAASCIYVARKEF